MIGRLGTGELLLIVGLALLIFGPKKLPEIGRSLGKSIAEFKRAATEIKESVTVDVDVELDKQNK